jgi:hypothetical protein
MVFLAFLVSWKIRQDGVTVNPSLGFPPPSRSDIGCQARHMGQGDVLQGKPAATPDVPCVQRPSAPVALTPELESMESTRIAHILVRSEFPRLGNKRKRAYKVVKWTRRRKKGG